MSVMPPDQNHALFTGLVSNCGDWVDSCTAVVEHLDGRLEIIHHRIARASTSSELAKATT